VMRGTVDPVALPQRTRGEGAGDVEATTAHRIAVDDVIVDDQRCVQQFQCGGDLVGGISILPAQRRVHGVEEGGADTLTAGGGVRERGPELAVIGSVRMAGAAVEELLKRRGGWVGRGVGLESAGSHGRCPSPSLPPTIRCSTCSTI